MIYSRGVIQTTVVINLGAVSSERRTGTGDAQRQTTLVSIDAVFLTRSRDGDGDREVNNGAAHQSKMCKTPDHPFVLIRRCAFQYRPRYDSMFLLGRGGEPMTYGVIRSRPFIILKITSVRTC